VGLTVQIDIHSELQEMEGDFAKQVKIVVEEICFRFGSESL